MSRSTLWGRRIHIAGSIATDPAFASGANADDAQRLVELLVAALVKRGANFVVPVDKDPPRPDGRPICFDWRIWKAIFDNLHSRPTDVPGPFVIAVQHWKNEDQIPAEMLGMWTTLRQTQHVSVVNATRWNMASKRMEAQAKKGEVLVAIGGSEGVLYLANLYHDAGRPVVPLALPVSRPDDGAAKLYDHGLTPSQTTRLFRTREGDPHNWLNRIRYREQQTVEERVAELVELLEALAPPRAFAVRLLDPEHEDFDAVQEHFDFVVQPVIEELGYELTVIDGAHPFEHARIDAEIFAKLHRSDVVLADITGARPNCFIELGYALGRQLPTVVMGRSGGKLPFDITTLSGLHWKEKGSAAERRQAFKTHWNAIKDRPPIVSAEPLIP